MPDSEVYYCKRYGRGHISDRVAQRKFEDVCLPTGSPRRHASANPASRYVPVQHGHAQYRRLHRLGPAHRPVHRKRLDNLDFRHHGRQQLGRRYRWLGRLRRRRHRRPDHHLSAADPHRRHRRPHRLRHPRRGRGRHCHHGRDRGRGRAHVPGRHDRGPARRLGHQEAGCAVGRQDSPRLRNAGRQFRGRYRGRGAGRVRLLRHRPGGLRIQPPGQQCGGFPGRSEPAAADVDLHRTGQGAVPQQCDQPRHPDPAGHQSGQ